MIYTVINHDINLYNILFLVMDIIPFIKKKIFKLSNIILITYFLYIIFFITIFFINKKYFKIFFIYKKYCNKELDLDLNFKLLKNNNIFNNLNKFSKKYLFLNKFILLNLFKNTNIINIIYNKKYV